MGRRVDVDDLVGTREIGGRLGVGYRVVNNWRRRHDDFPASLATISGVKVWSWRDVQRWAKTTGRL